MKRTGTLWAVVALVIALVVGGVVWQKSLSRDKPDISNHASTLSSNEESKGLGTSDSHVATVQSPEPNSVGFEVASISVDTASLPAAVDSSRRAEQEQTLDPTSDGWQTESFAEQASLQLKKLGKQLESEQVDRQFLESIAAPDYSGPALRPAELIDAFRDASVVVLREKDSAVGREMNYLQGPGDFAVGALNLAAVLEGCRDRHVKFKLIGVDQMSASEASTRVLFEATGVKQSVALQQTATWKINWRSAASGSELQIASIDVDEYQEVRAQCSEATLFADCTESVLGSTTVFDSQIRPGTDYWMQRLEGHLSPRLLEGHIAMSVGDVNNDGLEDLYVCQPGGLPNRLFLQKPDGSVKDNSAAAGVDMLDWSYGSLLIDLDNDGDQDLAVLTGRRLLLLSNDGEGLFRIRLKHPGKLEYSITAADYDNDGRLDIYLCNYTGEDRAVGLGRFGRPVPFHNATNGGANVLLRNEGNWNFRDVTKEVGLDHNNNLRWTPKTGQSDKV